MSFRIPLNTIFPIDIPSASETQEGLMSTADKTKLDNITSGGGDVIPLTTKNLVDNVQASLLQVDFSLITDRTFASMIFFAAEAIDATDAQIRSGNLIANVARAAAGTFAHSHDDRASTALTTGSLTVTWNWITAGNIATLVVTVASSLTPTSLTMSYYMPFATHPGAVSVVP